MSERHFSAFGKRRLAETMRKESTPEERGPINNADFYQLQNCPRFLDPAARAQFWITIFPAGRSLGSQSTRTNTFHRAPELVDFGPLPQFE